jgi:hypothetical protein
MNLIEIFLINKKDFLMKGMFSLRFLIIAFILGLSLLDIFEKVYSFLFFYAVCALYYIITY